jgi:hypothetical protein
MDELKQEAMKIGQQIYGQQQSGPQVDQTDYKEPEEDNNNNE